MSSSITRSPSPISAWFVQNNPIYLISAVCMLASCVMLANSSSHRNIPLNQLLLLSGTLLAYQVALFGMGAFLTLKRGVLRDGKTLLLLDAVFLADVTFVHTELLTSDLEVGLWVGIPLLLLAAGRAWWIGRRLLSDSFQLHRFIFAALIMGMLVAIPALLKHFDNGTSITAVTFYGLWWLAGLLMAAAVIVDHARVSQPTPRKLRWVQSGYLVALFVSLILHLAILHYVYDVTFYLAMLTPVLLALAMVLKYIEPDKANSTSGLQLMLVIMACVFGLGGSSQLSLSFGGLVLTPTKLTLAACYATLVYLYVLKYAVRFLIGGAIAGGLIVIAPTLGDIAAATGRALRSFGAVAARLLPSSRVSWGILGIIASFILLGLGVMISLRKAPEQPLSDDDLAPAPPPENPTDTRKPTDEFRLEEPETKA